MSLFGDAWDFTKSVIDPGNGANKAAKNIRNTVVPGFQNLGDTQWDRQMQGLGGALGSYTGSNGLWNQYYGSQGPGAMEDFYKQAYSQYGNSPLQSQQSLNNFRNNYYPTDVYNAQMSANNQLRNNYTQDAYGGLSGQLQGPSYGQQAYSGLQQSLSGPSALGNWYSQNSSAFNGPSRSEMLNTHGSQSLQNFADMLPGLQGTAQIERGANELGGIYRNANDVQRYASTQMPQLQGPGIYEQFVQADINGNNPVLTRATDQGLARINQEQARRGGFRSGSADTQIGNFLGEMQAQDYQNRAERAAQAQNMQIARIGQGQSLAQATSGEKMGQGGALQGLAGQRDSELRSRLDQQLAATTGASQENMANNRLMLDQAGQADQAQLARLAAGQNAASSLGDQSYRNAMGLMQGAGQADQAQLARMSQLYGMAQGTDAGNLARAGFTFNMGNALNDAQMARYGLDYNMSQGADAARQSQLMGMGQLASMSQGAERARYGDAFSNRFGIDNAMAGQYLPFYTNGNQFYGDAYTNAMNALANSYGLNAQGDMARAKTGWDIGSTWLKRPGIK